jgi:LysM repeat protein
MRGFTKIKTVRIEIEPDRAVQARGWIQEACGHGFNVIATYHKYSAPLGTDNRAELAAAASWWTSNYAGLLSTPVMYTVKADDTLSSLAARFYGDPARYSVIFRANSSLTDPGVIRVGQTLIIPARSRSFTVNLMNEWGSHSLTAREFAEAYNSAISAVRGVYTGPLIIDVPGYGQETAVAASAVKRLRDQRCQHY